MNFITTGIAALRRLAIVAGLATMWPYFVCAQPDWAYPAPPTPDAQRNALNNVRSQVHWLQNSTHTAPNQSKEGADMVWQQFQWLRGAYVSFKSTLTPDQLNDGANDLADQEAGLNIVQEAFNNYRDAVAGGQSESRALRNLGLVLRRAVGVWLQQLNKDCDRLRVGW